MKLLSRTTASVAAITAIGVTIGGVAYADAGSTPAQHQTTQQHRTAQRQAPAKSGMHRRHPLLRRTLHGSLVIRTRRGHTATVDIQRGAITAVSPTSLSVRSNDGVSDTYVLTSKTRIRDRRQAVPESSLKVGDRGIVVAVLMDGTKVARGLHGFHVPKTSTPSTTS